MLVTKRNGSSELFDLNKTRRVIKWATDGLDVNPLVLETKITVVFKDKIKTTDIQDNLIDVATKLISVEEPDWRIVAGRLYYMQHWKNVELKRNLDYSSTNYLEYVLDQVSNKIYDDTLFNCYTPTELKEAGLWIDKTRDLDYDLAGIKLLVNRYLLDNELPQEMFLTLALYIATVEEDKVFRLKLAKNIYDSISKRYISLATPILSNLRQPNGNLSSCFITKMGDSLDMITKTWSDIAQISKSGGGVGVNVSSIRSLGSTINGRKNASGGVIPFIKVVNDIALAIDQGGKRTGAVTVSIDSWHKDIYDFLNMQTETGDLRKKAFDIFPQVVVSDLFMRRVEENGEWMLVDPYEVKKEYGVDLEKLWGHEFEVLYKEMEVENRLESAIKVQAKQLFILIMETQLASGMPYLFFKDLANITNPNQDNGYIPAGNLCVAPETAILTKSGYTSIKNLTVDKVKNTVEIWNGFEWSPVIIRKTGENQKLLRVTTQSNRGFINTLDCTEYHKWHIVRDGVNTIVPTSELKIDDVSINYDLPTYPIKKNANTHFKIINIEDTGRIDDTYCFTEPKRKLAVFNCILTGNCMESFSNVSLDETHCCNLASLNLALLNDSNLEYNVRLSVRILDNLITLTHAPTKEANSHNNNYRTIGLGVMGYADWCAKNNLLYTESKKKAAILFETIAYYAFDESGNLGYERGSFDKYDQSELHKGIILGKLFCGKHYILVSDLLDAGYSKLEIDSIAKDPVLLNMLFKNAN